MSELTPKQELFCKEYLIDLNATQAAIRAGYSENSANNIGPGNLLKPIIQNRIAELMALRSERTKIDADWVLNRMVEIDEMDVLDIMNDDLSFKPLSSWPKCWRTTLTGIDIAELASSGDTAAIIKKIKWPDKVKNLELIGRHTAVRAFEKEQVTVNNVMHVMPVPTASSVEDWEAAASEVHEANLQSSS